MLSLPLVVIIAILVIILLCVWIWYHPGLVFTPLNFIYNIDTSYRCNFYTDHERDHIFPEGIELESKWKDIRDEGYNLYESLPDKDINYLDNYHIDMKDETKRNWTTIPLRLFGRDYNHDIDRCYSPGKILRQSSEIKSCLFSIMEPGKIINPHFGPYDGLIRYQLALDIPDPSPGEECYLHVGGEKYIWTEGKGVLFDESNLHGAVNTTKYKRMVLLIDIERPYSFYPFRILNKMIVWLMGNIT